MRLATDPPLCVVPSGSYRQKGGKEIKYYKVLQFKDKHRNYICNLTEEELLRIKSGYPAYELLNQKGIMCLPAHPKPPQPAKSKRESWIQDYLLFDRQTDIRGCVFKQGNRAYVYVKPFAKKENKSLTYVGAILAKKVWRDEVELGLFLRDRGYKVLVGINYVHQPERKKHRAAPSVPSVESEEEWVGYEMEAGDPQAIRDRYWDAREFLEACPNDEETARKIYGDDEVDDVLEREDNNDGEEDSKEE